MFLFDHCTAKEQIYAWTEVLTQPHFVACICLHMSHWAQYISAARRVRATLHLLHAFSDIQINVGGFSSMKLQPSGRFFFFNLWWMLVQMLIFTDLFKRFPFKSVYVYSTISSRKLNINTLEEMQTEGHVRLVYDMIPGELCRCIWEIASF